MKGKLHLKNELLIISVLHGRESFFISDKNIEVVSFNQCQVETLVRSRMKGELHLKNELLIISVLHGRESFFYL